MSKYSAKDMEAKYPQIDASSRGRVFALAVLSQLHSVVDELSEQLTFERKVNDRVNEIFKGWFHREG